MKKLILAFALFCATSFAFANTSSVAPLSDHQVNSLNEDISLSFTITGTNSKMLEELSYLENTSEFNALRVKACSITVSVKSDSGANVTVTFTSETCSDAAKMATVFLSFFID